MINYKTNLSFPISLLLTFVLCNVLWSQNVQGAANKGSYGYLVGSAGDVVCTSDPQYSQDISLTGTSLIFPAVDADDSEVNQLLPFDFDFFGNRNNQIRIGNNGGVLFGETTGDLPANNTTLPEAALPAAILPFWDDLDADSGGVYVQTFSAAPNRRFHIQWDRQHYTGSGATIDEARIQLVLFEATGTIFFVYPDLTFADVLFDNGISATAGIQKDASTALLTSFNTDLTTVLGTFAPQVECFEPRAITYIVLAEKASQLPACASMDLDAEFFFPGDEISIEDGEAIRFCIDVNNSLNQSVAKHRYVVSTNGGDTDVTVDQVVSANDSGLIITQPIAVNNPSDVTLTISSFDPVPENDFESTVGFRVDVGSVLDFLPSIISGIKKP